MDGGWLARLVLGKNLQDLIDVVLLNNGRLRAERNHARRKVSQAYQAGGYLLHVTNDPAARSDAVRLLDYLDDVDGPSLPTFLPWPQSVPVGMSRRYHRTHRHRAKAKLRGKGKVAVRPHKRLGKPRRGRASK